jgi:very-short-patch-repair endonuclease
VNRVEGRDRGMRRVGWHVDRVTDIELSEAFDATIGEIVDLIELRRRESAA